MLYVKSLLHETVWFDGHPYGRRVALASDFV